MRLVIDADSVLGEYRTEAALALAKVTPTILSASRFTPGLLTFLRGAQIVGNDWPSGFGGSVLLSLTRDLLRTRKPSRPSIHTALKRIYAN